MDTSFNFYSDSRGGDPDSNSPMLKRYHKKLWSKTLPNGQLLNLETGRHYLHWRHFTFDSDAITHSYRDQRRKKWLTEQIPDVVQSLFDHGSTIGAYTIFPNNKVNGRHTINQARGCNGLIDDRFDLSLECIRRFYLDQPSPLTDTFQRYSAFFDLFESFHNYIQFFLLDDLIDKSGRVKFYLPFEEFKSKPEFKSVDNYRSYAKRVMEFVDARNARIKSSFTGSSLSPLQYQPGLGVATKLTAQVKETIELEE